MTKDSILSVRTIFIATLVLVAAIGVASRFVPLRVGRIQTPDQTQRATSTAPMPLPTSASVPGGDVLAGLGPEWTILGQEDLTGVENTDVLKGLSPVRETRAKLVGKDATIVIREENVTDGAALASSLAMPEIQSETVGGRDVRLVPVADLNGGFGYFIQGTLTSLTVYAFGQGDPLQDPEVQAYVQTVNVR